MEVLNNTFLMEISVDNFCENLDYLTMIKFNAHIAKRCMVALPVWQRLRWPSVI